MMFSSTSYILHFCRFSDLDLAQIEQQNFQSRVNEIMSKKKQKLWEIQARVDSGKREVHCAKVWAKILDNSFAMFSFLLGNAIARRGKKVSHEFFVTFPGGQWFARFARFCMQFDPRTFVDTLDQHFRNAVGRMAQEANDEG